MSPSFDWSTPPTNSPLKTASSSPMLARLCQGRAHCGPGQHQPHGNVHGGALSTLADTVGGCCACSKGGTCVTSGCSIEYLRPANGSKIYWHRHPQKAGPHPVGGSPGDDQRPGGGGGHRHLYLLHAALSPSARGKQTFFPHIPAYFCFRRNSVDRDGLVW